MSKREKIWTTTDIKILDDAARDRERVPEK